MVLSSFEEFLELLGSETEHEIIVMIDCIRSDDKMFTMNENVISAAHDTLKEHVKQCLLLIKANIALSESSPMLFHTLSGVWNPINACVVLLTLCCVLFQELTCVIAQISSHTMRHIVDRSMIDYERQAQIAMHICKSEYRRKIFLMIKVNIEVVLINYCNKRVLNVKQNNKYKGFASVTITRLTRHTNFYWNPVLQSFDAHLLSLKNKFNFNSHDHLVAVIRHWVNEEHIKFESLTINKVSSVNIVNESIISQKNVTLISMSNSCKEKIGLDAPLSQIQLDRLMELRKNRYTSYFGKDKVNTHSYHQTYDDKYGFVLFSHNNIPTQIQSINNMDTSHNWLLLLYLFKLLDCRQITNDNINSRPQYSYQHKIRDHIHDKYFNVTLQNVITGDLKHITHRRSLSTELKHLRVEMFKMNNLYQPDNLQNTLLNSTIMPALQIADFKTDEIRRTALSLCENHVLYCISINRSNIILEQILSFNEKRKSYYHSSLLICHMLGFIVRQLWCNSQVLYSVRNVWTKFTHHCYNKATRRELHLVNIYAATSTFKSLPLQKEIQLSATLETLQKQQNANLASLYILNSTSLNVLQSSHISADSDVFLCILSCNCAVLRRWRFGCCDILSQKTKNSELLIKVQIIPHLLIKSTIYQVIECTKQNFVLFTQSCTILYYIIHYLYDVHNDVLLSEQICITHPTSSSVDLQNLLNRTQINFWDCLIILNKGLIKLLTNINKSASEIDLNVKLDVCKICFSVQSVYHHYKDKTKKNFC
jgi:hypothetical protein